MDTRGHIKFHRKFLLSKVRWQKESVVRLFLDLLLMVDYRTGTLDTSYRELSRESVVRGLSSLQEALKVLQKLEIIDFYTRPNLKISFRNWKKYQSRKPATKSGEVFQVQEQSVPSSGTGVFLVQEQSVPNSGTRTIHKVPVPKLILKNKEHFLCAKKLILDFENPTTDLEKLALFYLTGTKHPGLNKPNSNEILNVAIRQDLPHFETILANCRDLDQAKACVAQYVRKARGTYAIFYLAQQINSVRQEIESKENKHG